MPLFEVAVLSKPSKNDVDRGERQKLILKPTAVVAADATEAAAIAGALVGAAMLGAPDSSDVVLAGTEVLVRPFK